MDARTMRVRTRKWPDDPHWEFDAIPLGEDEHGRWVGVPAGTWLSRPGRGFPAWADHVVLVPRDAWWLATMYDDTDRGTDRPVDVYVDITTPAVWADDGSTVTAVDLDLDVVKDPAGRIWVDDEDEFAAHRVSLGYPTDVAEAATASARSVLAAVTARAAPYDGVHRAWIDRLRQKVPPDHWTTTH